MNRALPQPPRELLDREVFLLREVFGAARVARLSLEQALQQLVLVVQAPVLFFSRLQDCLELLEHPLEPLDPVLEVCLGLVVLLAVRLDDVCRPLQLVQVLAALLLQHLSSAELALLLSASLSKALCVSASRSASRAGSAGSGCRKPSACSWLPGK